MKATRNQVRISFKNNLQSLTYPDAWDYGTEGEFFYVEVIGGDVNYRDYHPVRDIASFRTTTHEV